MNAAYHAQIFGLQSHMISRVGRDDLGRQLCAFLTDKGIPVDLVQEDPTFPTGTVNVLLDEKGSPSYEIVAPVSWDQIHPDERAKAAVVQADALVFGSLACRTDRSKNTLLELLDLAPSKVFDVNLRPPFFSQGLLETLLAKTNLAKMNEEELETICGWYQVVGDLAMKMDFLKNQFRLDSIIVTKGPQGAAYLNDEGLFQHAGFKVKVQDTIGSGDAFLGAFLSRSLQGAAPEDCLATACAAGALVATKQGATPDYSPDGLSQLLG